MELTLTNTAERRSFTTHPLRGGADTSPAAGTSLALAGLAASKSLFLLVYSFKTGMQENKDVTLECCGKIRVILIISSVLFMFGQ